MVSAWSGGAMVGATENLVAYPSMERRDARLKNKGKHI